MRRGSNRPIVNVKDVDRRGREETECVSKDWCLAWELAAHCEIQKKKKICYSSRFSKQDIKAVSAGVSDGGVLWESFGTVKIEQFVSKTLQIYKETSQFSRLKKRKR